MKLHVTKEELLLLLTRAVNCTVEDVVIAKGNPKLYEGVITTFRTADCLDGVGGIRPECKIKAIKHLRESVYPRDEEKNMLGLGDSKWAIEHWNEFTRFIHKNRRFPKLNTSYPTLGGEIRGTME